jgi:NAD(P)-dependent dehydrogenase (short-subunit alcohol dehydrogenase family)
MNVYNNAKHDFANRIVLITGGTGALGSSIAKAFVESNATVILSYISDKVQMQKETIRKYNYSKQI